MKPLDQSKCKVHVFVCINERPAGKAACRAVGGQEFFLSLKNKLKESGLYSTHWVTKTGCLGNCNFVGCTVAIYSPGRASKWYTEVTQTDFDFIWNEIAEAGKE